MPADGQVPMGSSQRLRRPFKNADKDADSRKKPEVNTYETAKAQTPPQLVQYLGIAVYPTEQASLEVLSHSSAHQRVGLKLRILFMEKLYLPFMVLHPRPFLSLSLARECITTK